MQATKAKARRINLTKASIVGIDPPASGRTYTYDTKVTGLAVCTTAAGTKTFYTYRKVNGKPERIRIGPWPSVTVEQARDEAARINGKVADGLNPNDKRRDSRNAPTFRELFAEFVELPTRTKAKRPKSAKTKHDYRLQFDAYLAEWHDRQISTVTRPDVERLHNSLGSSSGIHTANRVLSLVKSLFNTAIDLEYFTGNPAARLRPFAEVSRERFLKADELPKFWAALEDESSEKIRDFIKVALFTGQRRGNVASMRWADVNLIQGVWEIPQTKTGRHTVPLTTEVVDILKRRHESNGESEYVFPGRHGREYLKDPMRQWREILARAGIENLRIHDLRRTLGSWQTATGSSMAVVGKTMNHKHAQTTAIYGRLELKPVRASMEAATAAMLEYLPKKGTDDE